MRNKTEPSLRMDRDFWILFAAGWTVCAGLLAATAVIEGEPPMIPLVILLSPTVFATAIASRRRLFLRPEWSLWKTVVVHLGLGIGYALVSSLVTTLLIFSFDLYDPAFLGDDPRALPFGFSFLYFLMYAVFAGFTMWTESFHRVEESRALAAREAVLRAEAEAKAVRAQFNPHFVFNTLHSLMLLVRADPRAAERAIEDVAALIRYASNLDRSDQDAVRLGQELEIARRYISLEALRLSDRLRVGWELDPDLETVLVPPFSLQTLLENAIKHGIAPKPEGGTIRVHAKRDGEHMEISVEDDGLGADPEKVRRAEGKGLSLLRSRVSTLFGDSGSLTSWTAPGEGFSAFLRVPIATPHGPEEDLPSESPEGAHP
jgi:two-component sensor histidine kinase